MSDLISRSELINSLKVHFDSCFREDGKLLYSDHICTSDDVVDLINLVENQPTAYDVEKVVTELNELDVKAIKRYKGGTFGNYEGTDYYIEKNDAIKIVKKEAEQFGTDTNVGSNSWIPCSERLPEDGGYYLVTYHEWSDGNFLPKYDDTYVRRLHYQISDHFVGWNYPRCVDDRAENDCHKEVIAWQPLPEVYKN